MQPVPENYPIVAPYLSIRDAAAALEFYQRAFGARERLRLADPQGKVMHAEIEIAGGLIMLADEFPKMGFVSPQAIGGTPVIIHLYVADVDVSFAQAIAAGATALEPPKDQFYGDRSARLSDPFGHVWSLATHIEDVSEAEMQRRFAAMFAGGPQSS